MKNSLLLITCSFLAFCSYSQTITNLTSGLSTHIYNVEFTSKDTGFAVGVNGEAIETKDGGITWNSSSLTSTRTLRDVLFLNKDTGFVVGHSGEVHRTYDGGANWSKMTTGVSNDLTNICEIKGAFYVTGNRGLIIKSTNMGTSWTSLSTEMGPVDNMYSPYFINPNIGLAGGYNGRILRTANGGASWNTIMHGGFRIIDIKFISDKIGYACGHDDYNNAVLMTTNDAGLSWTSKSFPNMILSSIEFIDSSTGYMVGGNNLNKTSKVYKTVDGGKNWKLLTTNSKRLLGLCFVGNTVGYAVGLDGAMIKFSGNLTNIEKVALAEKEDNVYVYPNPSTGVVNVDAKDGIVDNLNIQVYSADGKLVLDVKGTKIINLTGYTKGIYIMRISRGTEVTTKRILIK